MATPSVSILVTVYNREDYLSATLCSVFESTLIDWESIVVDDCSNDDSVSIAAKFAEQDSRFRVFQNEANLGDYANRNRAASLAKGKYLKYLDADDLIYPHSLAIMVEAMERFPEAGLALSRNVIDPAKPYPILYSPKEAYQAHFLGDSPLGVGPSAAIIRRDCFETVGGFSGRQFVGDSELWLKLAERWPVVSLPPALVWWRQHEGQQMQLEMAKPDVLNVRYRLELEMLRETRHLDDEAKRLATRRLSQNHARRLLSLAMRDGKARTAWRLIRDARLSLPDLARGSRGYA